MSEPLLIASHILDIYADLAAIGNPEARQLLLSLGILPPPPPTEIIDDDVLISMTVAR